MAESGDNRDENPFSFKKFIKAKNNDKLSSDSDVDDSEEENVVDLLETSPGLGKGDVGRSNRKADDNPFSFKRFLQASGNTTNNSQSHCRGAAAVCNGAGIATLDLANDLPDFVQDHYHSNADRNEATPAPTIQRNRTVSSRQPTADALLPDCALDTSDHVSPRQFVDNHLPFNSNGWPSSPETSSDGPSSRWLHHVSGADLDLRSSTNTALHQRSNSDEENNLDFDMSNNTARLSNTSSPVDVRHRLSAAHTAGGLPDFLSDSALVVTGSASVVGTSSVHDVLTNGLNNHNLINDSDHQETILHRLQEENRDLRRQLREAQELAQQEAVRAAEAVERMELSQKHEAEEAAALERMVQQVEANLESTTQRALHSESVVAKLKLELKSLQNRVESFRTENERLRGSVTSDNSSASVLRDRALHAAQQINLGALDAEYLLRQLLASVEKLRLVSDVLASTDQITNNHATDNEPCDK